MGDDDVMGKVMENINKTKNFFIDKKSLIITGIIVFILAIMFLLLGQHYTIATECGSLFISLSASMFTIIITIYLVDHIIKSGEERRQLNDEKLRKRYQWEFAFENDKQILNRYIGEIQEMIRVLIETMNDNSKYIKTDNKDLLHDYLKVKLRIKLANPPLTYSFAPDDGILESGSLNTIHNNMDLVKEFEWYINGDEVDIYKLAEYQSAFAHSRLGILKMKPITYSKQG